MRRPDPYQDRARELCIAAGIDPDSRVGEGRGMPAWCQFKQAAQQEEEGARFAGVPPKPMRGDADHDILLTDFTMDRFNIRAETPDETDNVLAVTGTMSNLLRLPTVVAGTVMPDACPTGGGEIPVGGVIAAKEAIHPGFHSADICCSMAVSMFDHNVLMPSARTMPAAILDAGMKISHFGGGGRPHSHDMQCPDALLAEFEGNRLLASMTDAARKHFGSQGDGNHFFYVGRVASTGQIALVTHHGSRAPGAMLYKQGIAIANEWRRKLCPETPQHAAWIPSETRDGEEYWKALQIIRTWTKKNHFAIHDAVAKHLGLKVKDRFWNEHNFVFRKPDGLFYHAKGATPAFPYWAADATDLTLIPLNMAQPILITRGLNADNGLGFAPHGAGRNMSRTAYEKSLRPIDEQIVGVESRDNYHVRTQTAGLDIRFFCGIPDVSELPGAYKNAKTIRRQIDEYRLAEVVDTIEPIGTIMAGDWQRNAPWRKKREKRNAEV